MGTIQSLKQIKALQADPLQFLAQKEAIEPRVHTISLFSRQLHLVFDAELARAILIHKSSTLIPNQRVFQQIKPITGQKGLVQLQGSESKQARKQVRPLFAQKGLNKAREKVRAVIHRQLDELAINQPIQVYDFMSQTVLKTAFSIFFGVELKGADSFVKDFLELNRLCGERMLKLVPSPLVVPSQKNRRIRLLRDRLRREIREILQEQLNEGPLGSCFRPDQSTIDQALTFLFAGHDTTASSLAFTLALLAENPQYQKAIVGDQSIPSSDSSKTNDLALNVYKESLRLYSPAYMLVREALSEEDVHGLQIKKGDQIIIATQAIHRSERYYEDSSRFAPERFSVGVGELRAFFPFGLGAKNCVGERLAYVEAVEIVNAICSRFHIESMGQEIESHAFVTQHPQKDLKLQFHTKEVRNVS